MAVITGTSSADSLVGSAADDEISGLGGNDTLLGGEGDDFFLGGAGRDTLNGRIGADTLNGGAGNDTLAGGTGNDTLIYDAADGSASGGEGTDTLKVNGSGLGLDLTVVADTVYRDLEVIDLTGSGDNMLTLARGGVLAFSSTTDTLRVDGNTGDAAMTMHAGWLHCLNVVIGGQTYAQYTNGKAVLRVDADINRSGIDTTVSKITLSSLNGTNGFWLDGIDADDRSGFSVATAGDVNGDGFDDLIVGAPGKYSFGGDAVAGESYVVYGRAAGFSSRIDLAALDGTNGFRIDGIDAADRSGRSVASAGDINNDGFDDLIIGASSADPSGESYVIYGKTGGVGSSVDLAALDGTNGFRLIGRDDFAFTSASGSSVASAGDVNGDGFDDLLIGAPDAGAQDGFYPVGESYVVFGKRSDFASSIDLGALDGANGFRLIGRSSFTGYSGRSVASAGDVNGDGFGDLIIGAPHTPDNRYAGESYVVFGRGSEFPTRIDLGDLNGVRGFRLSASDEYAYAGSSVSGAGDVNGDGFDDVIIGAYVAYGAAGASYVVFGKASGFASRVELSALDGSSGFRLDGIDERDVSGCSVAAAGDVNGDGFDDLIVGARQADASAGESYVVFGKASGFASSIDLGDLDAESGFRLDGTAAGDESGSSVAAAGDVNGDGFDDLIVGAPGADSGGSSEAGKSYVVFGADFTGAVTHLGSNRADSLAGTIVAETFVSGQGNDTIRAGGGADVIRAAAGNDVIRLMDTEFADVDGGSGADRLSILGGERLLDLTALANNTISGIEKINLAGSGDNTMKLSRRDLFDLSDTTNQLRVLGNEGDSVNLVAIWHDAGVAGGYHTYIRGGATILIDTDVFVT